MTRDDTRVDELLDTLLDARPAMDANGRALTVVVYRGLALGERSPKPISQRRPVNTCGTCPTGSLYGPVSTTTSSNM